MSIAKQLGKKLGGKWTYSGMGSWHCDDRKRHVSRHTPVDQFDNPVPWAREYWLYGEGVPRRAEVYITSKSVDLFL